LRAGMFELDKLLKDGMSQADFDRTRTFLSKYVNILTKSKSAELGYAIDSAWYGIPNYNDYVKSALSKLSVDDVNRAIRKHLRSANLEIVAVAKDAEALRKQLTSDVSTPIHYNTTKPPDVLAEDKIIEHWPLNLKPDDVKIVPVETVFEN
jgi:zinc protease